MKKVVLLPTVLLLFNTFNLPAQNLFSQLKTSNKNLYSPSGKASRDGCYSLAFYHNDSRNFYTFDPDGNIITSLTQTFPGKEYHQKPVGVKEIPDAFIYYFHNAVDNNRLEAYRLGKKEHESSFGYFELAESRKEKLLHTIEDREELYFLLMNKQEQKLILVRVLDEKNVERKEFPLSEDVFDLMRKSDFVQVYSGRENNFLELELEKAYLTNKQTLVLTREMEESAHGVPAGFTAILTLDFERGHSSFQALPPAFAETNFKTNTFILKDRLYKISGNKNFIDLSIYHFPSLNKLESFNYNSNQEIGLMGRGLSFRKSDDLPILIEKEKTRKILRKLQKGTLAVYAKPLKQNAVALRLGSFRELSGGGYGGGMMMPMGGGSISTPMGSVSAPFSFSPVYFGTGKSSTAEYYFDVLLNEQLEVKGHTAPRALQEKEEEAIEHLDSRRNNYLLSLPVSYTRGLMVFHDKKEEQLNIYQLGYHSSAMPATEQPAAGF
ncbi:hypothetical protein [Nafulsella turpanensis]|uniref:hypothetical protein n=1 Tax=Nafulsella turpanensis TaxID=1265690 RepID=UPI000348CB8E|nr:hypothetical protein [Nafulsella turpanensis]